MIGRAETDSPLVEEYRICNTPVIGAYVFWRFAKAYTDARADHASPHFLLFCFVSAMFSDRDLLKEMKLKRGISSFRRHLASVKASSLFDGIHGRVKDMLPYTMAALDVAYSCGILKLRAEEGWVEYVKIKVKRGTKSLVSKAIEDDAKLAEMLGRWFALYEGPVEVAQKLEVKL